MQIVPLSQIEVRKRQRSEVPQSHIKSLKESILNVGLLHPPVCWWDEAKQKWILTTGECRFRTIESMAKEGLSFTHQTETIPAGSIPISELREAVEALAFEAELDENVRRLDLSWQDRAKAYADLHDMRVLQNPKHTMKDTKEELVELNAPSVHGEKIHTSNRDVTVVREAQLIAENLHDPKVANARNAREAVAHIYRTEEARLNAILIKRTSSTVADIKLLHGPMESLLPTIPDASVDLILADPPYGISASAGGFRARSAVHHNYEDTPEAAREIAKLILLEGFRLTKPMANLLMFCAWDQFEFIRVSAANLGWVPFVRPLIWMKSESEGMAPWGGSGPRITTEFLFYATKGKRGMVASPTDVFDDRRVSRSERVHGAEKPVDLMKKLIECTTRPGDLVLDPCMGSGSTLIAARDLKRSGIGIEKDKDYFDTAFSRVHTGATKSGKENTP